MAAFSVVPNINMKIHILIMINPLGDKQMNKLLYTLSLIAAVIAIPCSIYASEPLIKNERNSRNEYMIILNGYKSGITSDDFYLTETCANPWVNKEIKSVSDDKNIYVFAEKRMLNTSVYCSLYTGWDEKIMDITLDLSKDNYINGWHIIPIYNKLQIVEITADKASFNAMKNCENKEVKCDGIIYTPYIKNGINAKIKGRGNSTWYAYGKRPYSVKTITSYDTFGIGRQKKWNFLANAHDKTLLKNRIWFEFAEKLELPYTPQNDLVHLFVNGEYQGVYQITTKIKQDRRYLPLNDNDYLLCLWETNPNTKISFKTSKPLTKDPDLNADPYAGVVFPKNINTSQQKQVSTLLTDMFDAINGDDDKRLTSIIDMESFAKLYWIEELSMNPDALGRSIYLYWDSSKNKICAGPLWDMDCTLGAKIYDEDQDFSDPKGWKIRNIGWWNSLMKHECFYNCVNTMYYTRNMEQLMIESVNDYRKYAEEYGPEFQMDFIENIDENQFDEVSRDLSSYKTYSNDTIDFYRARVNWIMNKMNDP